MFTSPVDYFKEIVDYRGLLGLKQKLRILLEGDFELLPEVPVVSREVNITVLLSISRIGITLMYYCCSRH